MNLDDTNLLLKNHQESFLSVITKKRIFKMKIDHYRKLKHPPGFYKVDV